MGIYYGSYDGAKSDFHHRFLPFHAGSEADRYIRSADHSYHCSSNCCFLYAKQYMESTLSLEMIEAARIDGSKEWNTFNKIILPIMKPAVATQAIFQFIAQWNNLFTPTILLTTDSKKTLPMFVQLLSSNQFRTDYGVVYVGLFVTIIPLVVVYLVLSKYIVAGVALGGVKG